MVLVSVGTQKQQFTRLIDLVLNSKEFKDEEIIIQSGYTKMNEHRNVKYFDFISIEEMDKYIQEADIVISHGGVGTIFSSLKKGKKVIAIPRLSKYGEHIDDHQIEICEQLENEGYLSYYKEDDDFDELVKRVKNTEYKKYISNKEYLDILRNNI